MTIGRVLATILALIFIGLCIGSYRWHQVRKCVDTRAFEVGGSTLGAKGTWCARWGP